MATLIDWQQQASDGVTALSAGRSTTRFASYLASLVSKVNEDPWIQNTFGLVDFLTLPRNYALETKSRGAQSTSNQGASTNQKSFDNYIFGHPRGSFRTVKSFATHVVSLLKPNGLLDCKCGNCQPQAQPPAPPVSSASAPITYAMTSSIPMDVDHDQSPVPTGIDDDGTPNVFDQLISMAMQGQQIAQAITEPNSIDWLLEREAANLPSYLDTLKKSTKRWSPRLGEIVLVARNFKAPQFVKYDEHAGITKIVDPKLGFLGLPVWEAAVVTQLSPTAMTVGLLDQKLDDEDASMDSFRVEPMSEIGNPSKPWSTRYKEVHPFNTRPFSHWQELMMGSHVADPIEWHPTVRHALTAMSSLSLVERYYFSSDGQNARIYCRGIYIGAEFITEGDVVLFSSPMHANSSGKDVIHIKHIYMSVRLDREPTPGSVHVEGIAYTTDPEHSSGESQRPIPFKSLPFSGMHGYGHWYKMEDGNNMSRVPYNRLIARLMDDVYMKKVVGDVSFSKVAASGGAHHLDLPDHVIDTTYGVEGVLAARDFSTNHDARIDRDEGQTWYLAEDRVDQLDLALINGQDVGDNARFGFESDPTPLQESHLKAMFRARSARQKGPKGNYNFSASSKSLSSGLVPSVMNAVNGTFTKQDLDDEEANLESTARVIDKYETEFTQRNTDVEFDAFMS